MNGEKILLGVSGGIAAYKACELVRRLRERGAEVQVVMTENATRFVTPATFQALSGRPVRTSLWDEAAEAAMGHIELARWADRIVIAPASAETMARLAHGHASDLLGTVCLATDRPVFLAPAMNHLMWRNAATTANVALLQSRGFRMLGPDRGEQACGETGEGRMMEPAAIVDALAKWPLRSDRLAGLRVLVNAGPTLEDIDPVRYIGNRSSGKMGFAVAEAAQLAGADVCLVAGPVNLPTPAGVRRIDIRSAAQLLAVMLAEAPGVDIVIASAAVADFRVREIAPQKIKRGPEGIHLDLVPNPDVLAEVARLQPKPFLVGFAAETENVLEYARRKLAKKNIDLIAANDVARPGCGFDANENALTLIGAESQWHFAQAGKFELARQLIDRIALCFRSRS
ncbi:MAG: bifunctional phosphopantothenoylcysteine decarboxylase/phosphopantothenate--cysteine ligase CoaBC [Ahniella sp.]|nr:bifunctional phosphopantothenoylcysteine decarboxylase/phosphopantothenate--cysteine ligase CoaBC [Ahniella sp.]